MKTKLTKITPDTARGWLKKNTCNRNVRQGHVDFLASEMANGRWLVTHQGICFDESGVLLDGQHRLLAVIQSGAPIEALVTTDAPKEVRDASDIGMCQRNIGDVLHMVDGMTEAALRVGACRHILSVACYYQSVKVSLPIIRLINAEFESQLTEVIGHCGSFKPAKKAWVIGTLAFCLSADKKAISFIRKFGSGEELKASDPAKTARDWVFNRSSYLLKKDFKKGAVECLANCILHEIRENKITRIVHGKEGFNHFVSKKRAFIDAMRDQMRQQIQSETNGINGHHAAPAL